MYMKKVNQTNNQDLCKLIQENNEIATKAKSEIDPKLINKNIKIQLIFNISMLCLGVFISLILSFITNLSISFLYGFLITIPFIVFAIYINFYELKKLVQLIKEKRFTFFMLIYFLKYFTIVVILAIAIILLILKIESYAINLYGILFGVIILIAIIMSSVYFFKKSLNTFQN